MRVDVKIPGGVDAYVIDLRGERCVKAKEVGLTIGMKQLRKSGRRLICLLSFERYDMRTMPHIGWQVIESWIPSLHQRRNRDFSRRQKHYFSRVSRIYTRAKGIGWQLGSDPEIQVATVVSNHLTAGIFKYFSDSFRLERAANLFERMLVRDPEISALLARSYIGMSELVDLEQY